ncbi:hypothetical protein A7985_06625 [Pseudoalteromonas luteoviolacea]|uniref:DUF4157 domain-containing protein n=1 Tax=Pseudoalteromonas luteoviolacea TaxID=43657 RepID=A0A1C0TWC4_9GAMM|nr:hypothetical protein [Pseudoalteromonas luteoviolacea]OCQ23613.1 hypothetical protein A7985_06625 [Pseudoalteromonas luteoviolacea]
MKIVKLLSLIVISTLFVLTFFHQKVISMVLLPQYIEWAYTVEEKGLMAGKSLSDRELSLAKEIGITNPEKIKIVYVEEVPFPHENFALKTLGEALGFIGEGIINNAQVFGYTIYVRNGFDLNKPKLAHELVHVLQMERMGLDNVVTQHFSDLAQYGYNNAPLEVEAFEANKKYSQDW